MATSLGRIFSSGVVNKIEVLYDEVQNSGLLEDVGTTAFALKEVGVNAEKKDLKVFDLTAEFGADSSAKVSINAAGAPITPFGSDTPVTASNGNSYAVLHVDGKLSAGITGALDNLPLDLSASGTASFDYDHYVPVAATENRAVALARLVSTAQLPQFEMLSNLMPGEVSRFQAALNLDLGLKGTFGKSFDIDETVKLFDGLSGQFKANVAYSLEASLGWSLFDDMDLVVARAQTNNANWVRIRIARSRQNSFTAGATFALQVDYDASSIGDALEKAFELSPLPRAIDILTKVSTTTWDQVKAEVTERASSELIDLIAGTGWKEKAAASPEVTQALAAINKVVATYNSVDTKVQQLWASLLVKVGAEPGSDLRKTIDTIAALDPQNPNLHQFLSTTAQKDLDMLESLTGKSIEQLLVGSNTGVQIAIAQAVSLAKQLQRVLTDTPTKITGALNQFAEKHGVKSAVTWLATNATSLDAIEKFGDDGIRKLVAKAVGKTFGSTTPADIAKVQAWATKLLAKWDELSAKLAAAAKFLKGSLGVNVSLEYSRVSESSAMLDFELDPANEEAVSAVRAQLPSGSVRAMLSALDKIERDDAGLLPYTIRESILVSRHTRTGATTLLLSFLGLQKLQKVTGSRFEESTIRVNNAGRTATFSGGFVQAVTVGNATSECGAWISADATAPTIDLDDPFASATRSMRLTFARRDTKASVDELKALRTLLDELGFTQTAAPTLDAPIGSEITFTLDIGLGEPAVKLFATDDGEENWNKDYRNAAVRLVKDDLVSDQLASVGQPIGEVLATVVTTPDFGDTWTDTSQQKFIRFVDTKGIAINGKTLQILNANNRIIPPYIPLQMMITRRPRGLRSLSSLRSALASTTLRQRDLEQLASGAASTFANTTLPEWDNPMFNFWFVVARLVRLANAGTDVLKNAVGVATFRFRATANDALSTPLEWSLTPNIGVAVSTITARKLFPFV
ncbi:MAG TPA: hypothetical protein VF618_27160 [Thermoanaerobaculia bacterium]